MRVLRPRAAPDIPLWSLEYIAQDNVDAADRRMARLFAAFETLAQSLESACARGFDAIAIAVRGGGGVSRDLPRGALPDRHRRDRARLA
jgi:plasmid stabilization system protein ParE